MEQKLGSRDPHLEEVRARIRDGEHAGPTGGLARGYVQTNLVVLPRDFAFDFLKFCVRNPRPCLVLEVTDAGSPVPWVMAPEADLRTDVPRYRVYESDELVDEPTDIRSYWRDDLVSFLIGCSFTFEWALTAAGVPLRHLEQGRNVPMYVTSWQCRPAGRLRGPLVVSMRPVPPAHLSAAIRESSLLPAVHGGPVHCGDPAALGIDDLGRPDFGDPVDLEPDDIPVFWACGVTPQAALTASRPPFALTHAPGQMFLGDARDEQFRVI